MINTFINYWSYLIENENKEISFETYMLSEDKKTYIQKHQSEEDFNKEILDKYWNEIRSRIKGKPEADIDKFWMNKSFKELADFVNNFDTRNQKERKTDKNKEAAIEAGSYYLGDMKAENGLTYEIWIPTSHKSANILRNIYKGGNDIGTAWCITVAGNDSYWNSYIKQGNNFIFLLNKDPILSKTDYRIDDKVAVQIEPSGNITLWDMNDKKTTLDINDFKSIIVFANEKGKSDKLFPNKYITIGGKEFFVKNSNIYCAKNQLTSLEGSPEKVDGNFDCSINQLTTLNGAPKKVGGDFNCYNNQLTTLEGAPREVNGYFDCTKNQLTSLEGASREVNGYFDCAKNQLTSLVGAPQKVGGDFDCRQNKLASLKGCPQEIHGCFNCSVNNLTSLKGAPQKVGGSFDCSNNQITSLEGAPQKISEGFWCSNNRLTSLEGAPKKVGKFFYCSNNQITSLEGAPEKVGGGFYCFDNKLTSLEGAPKKIGGSFNCDDNPDLPKYKIDAYKAYLKLPDAEKAPLTKNGHYFPTKEWEQKFL